MSAKYHSQLDDYLKSVLLRRRRSVGEYQDYRDYPEQGERSLAKILKTFMLSCSPLFRLAGLSKRAGLTMTCCTRSCTLQELQGFC